MEAWRPSRSERYRALLASGLAASALALGACADSEPSCGGDVETGSTKRTPLGDAESVWLNYSSGANSPEPYVRVQEGMFSGAIGTLAAGDYIDFEGVTLRVEEITPEYARVVCE